LIQVGDGPGHVNTPEFTKAIESEIAQEINRIRKDPKALIPALKKRLQTYKDKYFKDSIGVQLESSEGAKACEEAIAHLESAQPLYALTLAEGLSRCAKGHAADLSRSGEVSHTGRDGSSVGKRIKYYGYWKNKVGECIGTKCTKAIDFVVQWLIDDGVASRGDRKYLLSSDFNFIGVGYSGDHKKEGTCVVLVFANEFVEDISPKEEKEIALPKEVDEVQTPKDTRGVSLAKKISGDKTVYTIGFEFNDGTKKEVKKEILSKQPGQVVEDAEGTQNATNTNQKPAQPSNTTPSFKLPEPEKETIQPTGNQNSGPTLLPTTQPAEVKPAETKTDTSQPVQPAEPKPTETEIPKPAETKPSNVAAPPTVKSPPNEEY
jgi:uncharacterized protein YkwD